MSEIPRAEAGGVQLAERKGRADVSISPTTFVAKVTSENGAVMTAPMARRTAPRYLHWPLKRFRSEKTNLFGLTEKTQFDTIWTVSVRIWSIICQHSNFTNISKGPGSKLTNWQTLTYVGQMLPKILTILRKLERCKKL